MVVCKSTFIFQPSSGLHLTLHLSHLQDHTASSMRLMSGQIRKQSIAADQDSLVAMDALLQIGQGTLSESNTRSNSRASENVSVRSSSPCRASCDERSKERLSEAQNNIAATIKSLLPFNASNIFLSQTGQHPVAMAAAHVAAVSSGWKGAIVGTSDMLTQFSRDRGSGVSSRVILPVTEAQSLVGGEQPNLVATWAGDTSAVHVRRGSDSISSSSPIRVEKVEEALRSKPQRGRKRDDLNENERVELTRTRNREHAKSTRYAMSRLNQFLMLFSFYVSNHVSPI